MSMMRGTVGQLLIDQALPEAMRGRNLQLDASALKDLLHEVARTHPDKYREVSKKLQDIGRDASSESGHMSFGLKHLEQTPGAKKILQDIETKIQNVLANPNLQGKARNQAITDMVSEHQQKLISTVYDESFASKNPLALMVAAGARGNKMNLASLLGADLLYEDSGGRRIPFPVLRSYSQGLSPAEYEASTFGARKGVVDVKLATASAGFFGKQLNQAAHRLVVVGEDDDEPEEGAIRGLPVDVTDHESEGALLAHDIGPYKRNMVITPRMLQNLHATGTKRILVRSPLVGGSPDGGVYARDVGVRENGDMPGLGSLVGNTAAQALAEPISQGNLNSKHGGGVAGQSKSVGGFKYLDQLVQIPKNPKGGATHALTDGLVQSVKPSPAGGTDVMIDGKLHYVAPGHDPHVKPGDTVEAGDVISDGIPNPAIAVEHKGIGEGSRYFVRAFHSTMRNSGLKGDRRNIELLGKALVNHVRVTDEFGDHVPDDVIPYSSIEKSYAPREDAVMHEPRAAVGRYLERPVLHYTIGTKVRPSVLKDLEEFGVKSVITHHEPPPFQPEMVRAMYSLHHDPDPVTRMYGSGLKDSLLDSVHRGAVSREDSTSFVPGLAKGVNFGKVGPVRQPGPGFKPLSAEKLGEFLFSFLDEDDLFQKTSERKDFLGESKSTKSITPDVSSSGAAEGVGAGITAPKPAPAAPAPAAPASAKPPAGPAPQGPITPPPQPKPPEAPQSEEQAAIRDPEQFANDLFSRDNVRKQLSPTGAIGKTLHGLGEYGVPLAKPLATLTRGNQQSQHYTQPDESLTGHHLYQNAAGFSTTAPGMTPLKAPMEDAAAAQKQFPAVQPYRALDAQGKPLPEPEPGRVGGTSGLTVDPGAGLASYGAAKALQVPGMALNALRNPMSIATAPARAATALQSLGTKMNAGSLLRGGASALRTGLKGSGVGLAVNLGLDTIDALAPGGLPLIGNPESFSRHGNAALSAAQGGRTQENFGNTVEALKKGDPWSALVHGFGADGFLDGGVTQAAATPHVLVNTANTLLNQDAINKNNVMDNHRGARLLGEIDQLSDMQEAAYAQKLHGQWDGSPYAAALKDRQDAFNKLLAERRSMGGHGAGLDFLTQARWLSSQRKKQAPSTAGS